MELRKNSWKGFVPILVGIAVLASGCPLFGTKTEHVSILGGKVQDLNIRLEGVEGTGLCPDQAHPLVIEITTRNGKQYRTWTAPEDGGDIVKTGFLDYSEFSFNLVGGRLDKKGRFLTNPDALMTAGTGYKIVATVKDDVNLMAKVSFDPRIGCRQKVDFAGKVGDDGAAGGSGEKEQGAPGGDGGYGGNGGEVEVTTALVKTLFHNVAVLVKVQPKGGAPRHFLADLNSDEGFTVDCRGGDGGNGGGGGPGDVGGNGGKGGAGGIGGDGGVISGFFAFNQPLLQSYMKYRSEGGKPGEPGAGGEAGGRDSEGRPMLPGAVGDPGQPGANGPYPDVRPEGAANLFPNMPEGVFILTEPWDPSAPPPPVPVDQPAVTTPVPPSPEIPAAAPAPMVAPSN